MTPPAQAMHGDAATGSSADAPAAAPVPAPAAAVAGGDGHAGPPHRSTRQTPRRTPSDRSGAPTRTMTSTTIDRLARTAIAVARARRDPRRRPRARRRRRRRGAVPRGQAADEGRQDSPRRATSSTRASASNRSVGTLLNLADCREKNQPARDRVGDVPQGRRRRAAQRRRWQARGRSAHGAPRRSSRSCRT